MKGVNFTFEKGRSYAITGASGSGKSTLMHLLGGLDAQTKGNVFYDGKDLFRLKTSSKNRFLNRQIGFVFQFHYLVKELTVIENIILTGLIKGDPRKECKRKAEELLQKVGLIDKKHSYPTQLSGGELQRVAILRAIFNQPSFLLADEPTGDLDAQNAKIIVDFLKECKDEWSMGIIICSHDKSVYNQMETVLTLQNGILE